jgi:hypothetical protein
VPPSRTIPCRASARLAMVTLRKEAWFCLRCLCAFVLLVMGSDAELPIVPARCTVGCTPGRSLDDAAKATRRWRIWRGARRLAKVRHCTSRTRFTACTCNALPLIWLANRDTLTALAYGLCNTTCTPVPARRTSVLRLDGSVTTVRRWRAAPRRIMPPRPAYQAGAAWGVRDFCVCVAFWRAPGCRATWPGVLV